MCRGTTDTYGRVQAMCMPSTVCFSLDKEIANWNKGWMQHLDYAFTYGTPYLANWIQSYIIYIPSMKHILQAAFTSRLICGAIETHEAELTHDNEIHSQMPTFGLPYLWLSMVIRDLCHHRTQTSLLSAVLVSLKTNRWCRLPLPYSPGRYGCSCSLHGFSWLRHLLTAPPPWGGSSPRTRGQRRKVAMVLHIHVVWFNARIYVPIMSHSQ